VSIIRSGRSDLDVVFGPSGVRSIVYYGDGSAW